MSYKIIIFLIFCAFICSFDAKSQTDCEVWSQEIRTTFNEVVTPLIMSKQYDKVDSIFSGFLEKTNPCQSTGPLYFSRYTYYLHYLFENLKYKDSTLVLIDASLKNLLGKEDYESELILQNAKGVFLLRMGKMEEMNSVYTQAISKSSDKLPADNAHLINAMINHGQYYSWMGFKNAGLRHFENLYFQLIQIDSSKFNPPLFRYISQSYSDYLKLFERHEEAKSVMLRIMDRNSAWFVPTHFVDEYVTDKTILAEIYYSEKDFD